MNGILLVDKPVGITSHDVVQKIKKIVRPAKVGHSGTLDPAASGLLIVAMGPATRAIEFLDEARKTYVMTVHLGEETDTWDGEGNLVSVRDTSNITLESVREVLINYHGIIKQVPPHFSALKSNGVALYRLARKGVFPDLEPRNVEIFCLDIVSWTNPLLVLRMTCSRGTYARSVAHDVGKDLGVGARLESLRRIASGPYDVQNAITVDEIVTRGQKILAEKLMNLKGALRHIPTLRMTREEIVRLLNGSSVLRQSRVRGLFQEQMGCSGSFFKVLTPSEDCLVITSVEEYDGAVIIRPKKVLKIGLWP